MLAGAARRQETAEAAARGQRPPRSLQNLQDTLLHHVLSYLPSNDVVRLRGVSRDLRDAVHRIPGGLFVKLSISLPDARSDQRSIEAMTVEVAALRSASTVAVEAYAAALRSPRRPPGRTLEDYHIAALRATQTANVAAGRVRERSFRLFLAAGGARIVYAMWLDVVSFQGGGRLLWVPLSTLRNLFVSADNAGAGYPGEMTQQGLRSFYTEVERLANAAPQLRSLRISVRGYASQP